MTIKVNDKALKTIGILCAIALIAYAAWGLKLLLIKPFYTYELGKQAESFLAQGVIATHSQKAITINKSLIEYSVLKVQPTPVKTAAKK